MRSTRLFLAVTALGAALALSACSDDGGDEKPAASPSSSGSASASESASDAPLAVPANGCRAQVTLTGAAEDEWTGKGYTSQTDDADLYRASKGKKSIFLNVREDSADLGVQMAGKIYSAKPKDVEVESTDTGVDVTAKVPVKGGAATVTATFACAEG